LKEGSKGGTNKGWKERTGIRERRKEGRREGRKEKDEGENEMAGERKNAAGKKGQREREVNVGISGFDTTHLRHVEQFAFVGFHKFTSKKWPQLKNHKTQTLMSIFAAESS